MSPEPSAEMQAVFSMAGISKSGPQYKDKILPADDNFLKIVAVGGSYWKEVRVLCVADKGGGTHARHTGKSIAVPLYKKVSHGVSWERKRDIAKSRDHVIKASLADKHPSGEVSRYDWHATYHYTIDGKERQYTAYFKHPSTPPLYLYLYYVDDPDKLFSCEEYHYENHKGLLLLPVIFLPWILAGIALVLLGVDLSGF